RGIETFGLPPSSRPNRAVLPGIRSAQVEPTTFRGEVMKDLRLPSTGALLASALLLLMIAGCEDTVSDGSSSTSPDGSAKAEVAEMEYALNQVAQNPDKLVI